MNAAPDLIIHNCGQLLTVAGASQRPKVLRSMNDLGIIVNGAVAIKDGIFTDIGTTRQLEKKYPGKRTKVVDAMGRVVLPGFVDCHTHAVFGGDRTEEFLLRMRGEDYLAILKKGGGILSTVEKTRKLPFKKLAEVSKKRLDTMLLHGTTTVEIKSGYGLDKKNELEILKVIQYLQKTHPMDVVPTFLGAHAVPPEYQSNPDAYVDLVCDMLPEARPLATFCDVFCDEGGFTVQQAEKILSTAKELGFRIKIHINEFQDIGGATLAAKMYATSVDHLDNIKHHDIVKLKTSEAVCVLLPGVPFFLMKDTYAHGKKMVEKGLPVALATDFNPGTCPCENIQMIITLACLKLGMTPAQAINAVTINAAHAIGKSQVIGSIEVGKQADLLILDILDYNQLAYYFGTNHVHTVVKKGRLIVENGRFSGSPW